ncbi:hypothetical protein [Streptomyces diastatochromogenes]|uniref:hypothetical protein n=1 Tax=Streptomyces diastatochromogenes TaxID=42236 RepID=UPI00367E3AD0
MAANTPTDEPPEIAFTRRDALKLAGLGIGSVVALGVGVGGVRAITNGAFSAASGDPYDLWHDWSSMSGIERVVAAGVLACNPHNTQPWRIAIAEDTIDVHSDPSRRMPLNDASGREHFAGLGCAVESMVIAAGPAGFTADVALFPDGIASEHVARVVLRDGGPAGGAPGRDHCVRGRDPVAWREQAGPVPDSEPRAMTCALARSDFVDMVAGPGASGRRACPMYSLRTAASSTSILSFCHRPLMYSYSS